MDKAKAIARLTAAGVTPENAEKAAGIDLAALLALLMEIGPSAIAILNALLKLIPVKPPVAPPVESADRGRVRPEG